MPPLPFPFPLNIGTDIVHVKRIHGILLRAQGKPGMRERFLRRFLTPGEVLEFQTRFSDVANGSDVHLSLVSKHLAGRWAAKEATIKAVTWRRLGFHDVLIRRMENDRGVFAIIEDGTSRARELNWSTAYTSRNGDIHPGPARADERLASQHSAGLKQTPSTDDQGRIAKISISHDGDYATAVCLAAEES